jgi:hypothetical protein
VCGGGGGGGGDSDPLDPCSLLPTCRAGPDYDRDRFTRRGLDQDIALLLLQGVGSP